MTGDGLIIFKMALGKEYQMSTQEIMALTNSTLNVATLFHAHSWTFWIWWTNNNILWWWHCKWYLGGKEKWTMMVRWPFRVWFSSSRTIYDESSVPRLTPAASSSPGTIEVVTWVKNILCGGGEFVFDQINCNHLSYLYSGMSRTGGEEGEASPEKESDYTSNYQ